MTARGTRRPMGVSARVGVALVVLGVVMYVAPQFVASNRLAVLGWTVAPVEAWLAPRDKAAPAGGVDSALIAPAVPSGSTWVPVLDVRLKFGTLVIGAGSESGIELGEAVTFADALVGFVDRVELHVARVQLLTDDEASVAVIAADSRPASSGAIVRRIGLLKGANPPRLVKSPMPEAFVVGDALVTVGGEGSRVPERLLVGHISVAGPVPSVKLAADPTAVGQVVVRQQLKSQSALFHDEAVTISAYPLTRVGEALVRGSGLRDACPGLALTHGGRFLGRIIETSDSAARVSLVTDIGHEVIVRWVDELGQTGSGTLTATLDGLYDLTVIAGQAPGFPMQASTAGGQALIPQGLAVGRLVPEGGRWRLIAQPHIPRHAVIPIFLEIPAWRKLHPDGRRG